MPHVLIIASRNGRNVGSAAIRAGQLWRAWSHTADVLTAGDYTQTVEALALAGGVVVRDVAELIGRRSTAHVVLSREVSSDVAAARDEWLCDQRGKGYDWLGAVGGAWLQVREWQDDAKWFCSELSAAASQRHGLLTVSPYIRGVMPTQCVDLHLAAGWQVVTR